jgi:sugar lactone lactonase YvrE
MKKEYGAVPRALTKGDLLKNCRTHASLASGLALMFGLVCAGAARAETAPIGVPDKSFPESVTSTHDGTLYVGSFNLGGVLKIAPDGKAEQFIKPGAGDSRSTLGVLADEKRGTLYVCSNDLSGLGVASPGDGKGAWLKTFDLASGAPKGSFALADPKSFCNDIVVSSDGTAYVTDSFMPNVYSLKPGGTALEVWATDPSLAPAKDGVGLDGIAIGSDGNLYVTTYIPAKLFEIAVRNGKAGEVFELKSSRPLDRADAMRALGEGFLLIEGNGKLDRVAVKGKEAEIETIKDGFAEPVSVTQVGSIAWVAEGKLSFIIGPNKGKDPGPFKLQPVPLPK